MIASRDVILGKITNNQEPSTRLANLKDQSQWIQVQLKGSLEGPLVDFRMTGMGMVLVGNLVDNVFTMDALGIWREIAGIVLGSSRSNTRENSFMGAQRYNGWQHEYGVVLPPPPPIGEPSATTTENQPKN